MTRFHRIVLSAAAFVAGIAVNFDEDRRPPHPHDDRPVPGSYPEFEEEYFRQWLGDRDIAPEDLREMSVDARSVPAERLDGGMSQAPEGSSAVGWESLGPYGMIKQPNVAKFSGRVLDIHSSGAALVVASASGGLWTIFLAAPFELAPQVSSQRIGSFTFDPNDGSRILIGTGEGMAPGGSAWSGTGMFVTTNTGNSWDSVPMSPAVPKGFFKLRFSPTFSSRVFAATTQGLYRSTNSGASFERVLTGSATDVAMSTNDPDLVYTAIWGDGIYRSTNGGASFAKLTGGGIPTTDVGRTSISVCETFPTTIYVAVTADDGDSAKGIWRTNNADDPVPSWTDVSVGVNYMRKQGWYNNAIAVHPVNPDIVYAGGVSLWRTTDGGDSWTQVEDDRIHSDHHVIRFSPDGKSIHLGNDGGYCVSDDEGATWSTLLNPFPITQYTNIDYDPNDPRVIAGGSQDNGISITTNGGTNWTFAMSGDGGGVAFDNSLESMDYQRLWWVRGVNTGDWTFGRYRSGDYGATSEAVNDGVDPSDQWYMQVRTDRDPPVTLYTFSDNRVYSSTDFGTKWEYFGNPMLRDVKDLRAGKGPDPVLWASTRSDENGVRLYVWTGALWSERSFNLPSELSIRAVIPHPESTDVAYALMNGTGPDAQGKKVYRTTNLGVSWQNISGNLPDVPMGALAVHPANSDILAAGTFMGCYATTDGGFSWYRWNNGMPEAVLVTDMLGIDSTDINGKWYVVAGTYGRGVWKRQFTLTWLAVPFTITSQRVTAGWNLLSVPLTIGNPKTSKVYPTAVSPAFAYEGAYVARDPLETGPGYWLKFDSVQTLNILGVYLGDDTIDVAKGWNMVGSLTSPIDVADVGSIPGGIVASQFFGYDGGGYDATDSIYPGMGYWVKTDTSGKLVFSVSGAAQAAERIRIVPTDELPPPPPEMAVAGSGGATLPDAYALMQNYPNPFNPATVIAFSVPRAGKVTVTLYDALGREVLTLFEGVAAAGRHEVGLNAQALSSGIYFFRMEAEGFSAARKMVLMK